MYHFAITSLGALLLVGCVNQTYPLDGSWQIDRDKTQLQRAQRLGEMNEQLETSDEWVRLKKALFQIESHRALRITLPNQTQLSLPMTAKEIEPNLWMIRTEYAKQNYQMKAVRVDQELRVLDSGHLFVLEEK